jgi:predicted PurR-regulated permease PerM
VLVLAAAIGTTIILYYAKDLFILAFIAGIFAFLLHPLVRKLEALHFPTWAAAMVGCLLTVVLVLCAFSFLGWQYAHFGKDLPALKTTLIGKIDHAQRYFESRTNVSQSAQTAWLRKEVAGLADSAGSIMVSLFSTTGAALATIVLIPIFTFFLLLLKGKFRAFFERVSTRDGVVLRVVQSISVLSRKWLKGVLTVMLVLSVLNSIGFLALGLKYAVLLGVTAAILNVIPYIGPWIGALMPVTIALLTKDSAMYAVGAAGVILITQFIDNNFVTPKVVGSSVSINPLASIVALLAGGMLWGVVGLVLAIPITGMLKLVFDEIPGMQPWGFLLGEEKIFPERRRIQLSFGRKKSGEARPK